MISFLFSTLGAVGFWAAYIVIGSVVGTMTLSAFAKLTFKYITTGKGKSLDTPDYVAIALVHYLLWPISIVYLVLAKIAAVAMWAVFVKWILIISKSTPTIEFNYGDKKEKEGKRGDQC